MDASIDCHAIYLHVIYISPSLLSRLQGCVREHGDAGDNQRTAVEGPSSFTHRSNPKEPRQAYETRHGGRGEARCGIIPRFSMLSAFFAYFLCHLHLEQRQLDELYAVLRDLKAGKINDDEAIRRLERSPYWVWTVMDPTSKLLLMVAVGSRTLAMAQRVVHQVTQMLAPGCVPLCDRWPQGLRHGPSDP